MKNIIVIALASLVLFGISAGLSVWLSMNGAKPTDSAHGDEKKEKKKSGDSAHGDEKESKDKASEHGDPHKVEAKPTETKQPNGKDADRVEYRRLQLDVVAADLSGQMQDYDTLVKKVSAEMKVLLKEQEQLDAKAAEVKQIEDRTAKTAADIKKGQLDMEEDQRANLLRIAGLFDQMPPESAAGMLTQWADSGKTDTAVKVLSLMKPTKATKVLTSFTDPTVPQLLLDRMEKLKRPPVGTP